MYKFSLLDRLWASWSAAAYIWKNLPYSVPRGAQVTFTQIIETDKPDGY